MSDQAQVLRGLMEHREETPWRELSVPKKTGTAQTISITSGKGGVGKSNIALNLGIALAQSGHSVCLLDANLGLGNIDLLCGLNGYWNLSHVMSGTRTLDEVCLQGPGGLHVIPGASGLSEAADCSVSAQRDILAQLAELEARHEFLLIDTGTGIHRTVRHFVAVADLGLIVTTPEPTAIADAYAMIKALSTQPHIPKLEVLVNRSQTPEQARDIIDRLQRTTQMFIHNEVGSAGFIPEDECVMQAVARRTPFCTTFPGSPASLAIEQLARRVNNVLARQPLLGSFSSRLWSRLGLAAA
jgi:flagellar biosynthesis protein FlhG